jgi:hypothetical protein
MLLVLAGLPPLLYCLALVGWQFINYLQMGIWGPLPVSLLFTDHPFRFLPPPLANGWLTNLGEMWRPAHDAVAWMFPRLHVGAVFAAPGMLVMAIGASIATRRAVVVRSPEKLQRDRPRDARVRHSREQAARVEPFIGSDTFLARDKKAA